MDLLHQTLEEHPETLTLLHEHMSRLEATLSQKYGQLIASEALKEIVNRTLALALDKGVYCNFTSEQLETALNRLAYFHVFSFLLQREHPEALSLLYEYTS